MVLMVKVRRLNRFYYLLSGDPTPFIYPHLLTLHLDPTIIYLLSGDPFYVFSFFLYRNPYENHLYLSNVLSVP